MFDISGIGPTLVNKRHAFGTNAFAIEATDGITSRKARPIRNHELLAAFGFDNNGVTRLLGDDTDWRDTFARLSDTAPAHTWEPVLAALCAAEIAMASQETVELYKAEMESMETEQDYHHTDS